MAKIDNKWFLNETGGEYKKVGNNRTVLHTASGLVGKLHGHVVIVFDRIGRKLHLKTAGYRTTTTRQAIVDFLNTAPGFSGNVSFAKGEFWATVNGVEKTTDGDELTFDF